MTLDEIRRRYSDEAAARAAHEAAADRVREIRREVRRIIGQCAYITGRPVDVCERVGDVTFDGAACEFVAVIEHYCGEGNWEVREHDNGQKVTIRFPARWLSTPLHEVRAEVEAEHAATKARRAEREAFADARRAQQDEAAARQHYEQLRARFGGGEAT